MEASKHYRLSAREAADVLKQVQGAVAGWREEATRLSIPKAEQDLMSNAFQESSLLRHAVTVRGCVVSPGRIRIAGILCSLSRLTRIVNSLVAHTSNQVEKEWRKILAPSCRNHSTVSVLGCVGWQFSRRAKLEIAPW